jgi:hypothetical protein
MPSGVVLWVKGPASEGQRKPPEVEVTVVNVDLPEERGPKECPFADLFFLYISRGFCVY